MSATADLFRAEPSESHAIPPSHVLRIEVPGEMRGKDRHRTRLLPPKPGSPAPRLQTYPDPRTVAIETRIAWCAKRAMAEQGVSMFLGPVELTLRVTKLVPPSWSKRRQADALAGRIRPTTKPDTSNYAKLEDALNGVAWRDDSQVVDLHVHKFYGLEPGAVLEVRPL